MHPEVLRFRQHDEGLCGLYTIVNALAALYPGALTHVDAMVLVDRLMQALPGEIAAIIREGTDRAEMDLMLAAARRWTQERGYAPWRVLPMHPNGGKAQAFWDGVVAALAGRAAIVLVGFGDDDQPRSRYEPHWTCIGRITPRRLELIDSDVYRRVARAETALRPEHGWEIEDCYILERL